MASKRALNAKAARIRLLLFDVDGVLTDGTLEIHGDGTESKRFHIRDGAAIVWAHRAGLLTGLLSARPSPATERRATVPTPLLRAPRQTQVQWEDARPHLERAMPDN